jgi:tRNA(Arg) A34 adenosine deaminase TadA/CheY-like chemotaxis protein
MTYKKNLRILIADSDEHSRIFLAGVLTSHSFDVIQAINGGAAIKVLEEHRVDLAVFAQLMIPQTGFDVARHILAKGLPVGMIMVVDQHNTDLLIEAGKHEIKQLLSRPVDPDRFVESVNRVLRATGHNPSALAGQGQTFVPSALMRRAIALAHQNSMSQMGGPFGAVVADPDGRIIGEGVNGVTTRCDPTAHAEVLAIRRATEHLSKPRLDGCSVYCSSEPTMLGQALIISVGIDKVYYGLGHSEAGPVRVNDDGILGEIAKPLHMRSVPYEQLLHDEAETVFRAWEQQKGRVAD